jgi:CheY-like chemotaxis protein
MIEEQPNVNQSSLTIFLADDDEDDQQLLKEAFTNIDANVTFHIADNGKQALNSLNSLSSEELPCLIVLDYNMPELSGAEVLQHIVHQQRYTGVPKVIWTTSNSPVHKEYCLSIGADDYLVKPDNIRDIEGLARKMLQYCRGSSID